MSVSELPTIFSCIDNNLPVTAEMKTSFDENGYIIVRSAEAKTYITLSYYRLIITTDLC